MHLKKKAEKSHEEEAVEKPEAKAATEPWNPKTAADSPRKRGILGITGDKKGHELRWVRQDSIDRRKAQGYVLATPSDFDATPDENGMIRRNELVLMVVPTETYNARRRDVLEQAKLQSKSAKREFLNEREAASRQSGHSLAVRDDERDEE